MSGSGVGGALGYADRHVVVSGCASGMGHATASLLVAMGARVHGIDLRAPDLSLAGFSTADLRDPASIDAAVAAIDGPVQALFNCAGLGPTFAPMDIFRVNFVGLRHLTERLIDRMPEGSAIGSIASTAAMAWRKRPAVHDALLGQPDYAAAVRWGETHADEVGEGYVLSKEAVVAWTLRRSRDLIGRGIRINCILPAITQTPMLTDQIAVGTSADRLAELALPIGRPARPEEQAWPLVMLTSPMASYVNGAALNVDGGRLALIGMV